jgi:hypothetical protein
MRYHSISTLAVAVIVMAVTACHAEAQTAPAKPDVSRASALEKQAETLQKDMSRWGDAADLLRKAARLRPGSDPIALTNLQIAGAIYHFQKSYFDSQMTMVELAERASRHGEVSVAAHAWLDATFAARKRGEKFQALTFLERAQLLAKSSHLTSEEQAGLAVRLRSTPEVIVVTER